MLIGLIGKTAKWIRPYPLKRAILNTVIGKERFFSTDRIYDPFLKKISKRLILELPGGGCAWYKASGGCTMCGFNQKLDQLNSKRKFSASDLTGLYEIAEALSSPFRPEIVYVYNGGSFLNQKEIPQRAQLDICRLVSNNPGVYGLFVESRPEFVRPDTIVPLKKALGTKYLEIGIGLEAVSDKVREINIHKGFSRQDYEDAVQVLKKNNVRILTYVFLKPLGLSEKEAIEEAVKTIAYAFRSGSDEVSLSCAFIQEGTKLEKAYRNGEFRPPWLWSVIEVIKQTADLGPVRIGSFEDEPPPVAIPFNCGRCDSAVVKEIERYNLHQKSGNFDEINCECQKEWKEVIK